MIETIADNDVRSKLEEQLMNLEGESAHLLEQTEEVEQAQDNEQKRLDAELSEASVERLERRLRVWKSFLERESMATVVGSILLILLTVCLLIAMFFGVQASEVVSNAFLLILGYFFGQTVSRRPSGEIAQPDA